MTEGVSGRFGIDIQFSDSTTVGGALSLKTIAMQEAAAFTGGKVAFLSGTVGTNANVGYSLASLPYTSASGSNATISSLKVAMLYATPAARLVEFGAARISLASSNGVPAVGSPSQSGLSALSVAAAVGATATARYEVILYGT